MKGMRKGKHYNQGWLIRKSFSKLIFRLYIERYIDEKDKGRLFLYDPLSDVDDPDFNLIQNLVLRGLNCEFGVNP